MISIEKAFFATAGNRILLAILFLNIYDCSLYQLSFIQELSMEQRERWGSRTLFILAAVGSAAGLGNLWRFPYLAYKYGGGAFLVPFFIILFVVGIPLLLLEFSIGQRFQKSAIESMYKVNRHFSGVGVMGVCNGFIITGYYAVVMAWAVIFLVNSFNVAWAGNESDFFYSTVLGISSGIDNIQSLRWPIVAGLAVVWWQYISVSGKVPNLQARSSW
jgi:NSS family neurotransmitter:Na+ symporter